MYVGRTSFEFAFLGTQQICVCQSVSKGSPRIGVCGVRTLAFRGRKVLRISHGSVFCSRGETPSECESFPAGPASSPVHTR